MTNHQDLDVPVVYQWIPMDGLSAHANAKLNNIVGQLQAMSNADRVRLYDYGMLCRRARDTIIDDGGTEDETVVGFVTRIGLDRSIFYQMIRLVNLFEPYVDALPKIALSVQRHLCSRKLDSELFEQVISEARKGKEITREYFQAQLLLGHQSSPDPPQRRLQDQQEWDDTESADDDTQTPEEIEQNWAAQQAQKPAEVPFTDSRAAFVVHLAKGIQGIISDLDDFMKVHKVPKAPWFRQVEESLETILQSLKEWQRLPAHKS